MLATVPEFSNLLRQFRQLVYENLFARISPFTFCKLLNQHSLYLHIQLWVPSMQDSVSLQQSQATLGCSHSKAKVQLNMSLKLMQGRWLSQAWCPYSYKPNHQPSWQVLTCTRHGSHCWRMAKGGIRVSKSWVPPSLFPWPINQITERPREPWAQPGIRITSSFILLNA